MADPQTALDLLSAGAAAGTIGVGALLGYWAYTVLRKEQDRDEPRKFMMWLIGGFFAIVILVIGIGGTKELIKTVRTKGTDPFVLQEQIDQLEAEKDELEDRLAHFEVPLDNYRKRIPCMNADGELRHLDIDFALLNTVTPQVAASGQTYGTERQSWKPFKPTGNENVDISNDPIGRVINVGGTDINQAYWAVRVTCPE